VHTTSVALVAPPEHRYPAAHTPEHVERLRPVAFPKYPSAQLKQVAAPPRLYLPTGHTTSVGDVALGKGHANPALQFRHWAAPGTLLNFPGTHPSPMGVALVAPGLHANPGLQSLQVAEPCTAYWPAPHSAGGMPLPGQALPAGHGEHGASLVALNHPGRHVAVH
jgi:hypothetical protein